MNQRLSVHVTPEDFQAILAGLRRHLVLKDYVGAGDLLRVHLKDRGTGPPCIECRVTFVELQNGTVFEESGPDEVVTGYIASIKKGLDL